MSICSRDTTNMNVLDKALTSSKYDYPSITPYHALGTRGGATDRVLAEFEPGETILWTRKLDGSNTKILLHNDIDDLFDFLIGTREGWLYADGDRRHGRGSRLPTASSLRCACSPSRFASTARNIPRE